MKSFLSFLFFLLVSTVALAADRSDEVKRLQRSTEVLQEIMKAPDKGIPQDLLDKAACIVVVPGLKKGGIGLGAKYGKGEIMCRTSDGKWSAPLFITIEGGSVGLQLGFTQIDVVMLIMNHKVADKLIADK